MHIVAALFVENFSMRQVEGPSTRLDLSGVFFSQVVSEALPCTLSPHLVVLVYCPAQHAGDGVLQVVFHPPGVEPESQAPLAQHIGAFRVEPGKFTYRLVRAELPIESFGQVLAHCRIGTGSWMTVPLTLLAPPSASDALSSQP